MLHYLTVILITSTLLIVGFAIGYIIASLIESYMHELISDAPRRRVRQWQRYPRLLGYLIRTHYSHHVIHHCKTYKKNYVTQFTSFDEKVKLNQSLSTKGKHGYIIQVSQYAAKLHGSGSLVFVAPLAPAMLIFPFIIGIWASIGAVIALLLPPILSNFVHPYLHMPHDIAIQQAPKWLSPLLKTRYFKAMARNHYMHHRYVVSNFNLLLGGDILRGKYQKPSTKDIADMQQLGLAL